MVKHQKVSKYFENDCGSLRWESALYQQAVQMLSTQSH